MSDAVRLTAAQAAVRYLAAQHVPDGSGGTLPYFAGCWAIFGHGNVAGLGEALHAAGDTMPTLRAHNEQAMAHAAIAFAKQNGRRRAMICTSSIGPGATNMVTAAALAHINRLPVLFLPGDVFASRRPDPVLQQIESCSDATVSANDCFRPVSRLFDRITRPDQLIDALPRAMATLLDPVTCGPVTLAFCQDVQTEPWSWPEAFFRRQVRTIRAPRADEAELEMLAECLRAAHAPLIVAGGGVRYAGAEQALAGFAAERGIPVVETQAGKGALAWDHPMLLGAVGVTGTGPANTAAASADLVIAIGTRLQDFTTASRTLFSSTGRLFQVNVAALDAAKHGAQAVVGDARTVIEELTVRVDGWRAPINWTDRCRAELTAWNTTWEAVTAAPCSNALPSDAQVLGAVWRTCDPNAVVVCAAGGLPGELHKLWRTRMAGGYHVEYGYSCMGYEIAGGLGVKLAEPLREVHVLVGDGSYLMMNSEIATSVALRAKLIITLLDNRGFGCIRRLQEATGGASFHTLLDDEGDVPAFDLASHAASLGARTETVTDIAGLEAALGRARAADRTSVIVIRTDPLASTQVGGAWWDVAVPAVSTRPEVAAARAHYERRLRSIDNVTE